MSPIEDDERPEAYTKVAGGLTPEQQEALHRFEQRRTSEIEATRARAEGELRKRGVVRRLRDDTPAALLEDVLEARPPAVVVAWVTASGQLQVQAVANDAQWAQLVIATLATALRWQLEEAIE